MIRKTRLLGRYALYFAVLFAAGAFPSVSEAAPSPHALVALKQGLRNVFVSREGVAAHQAWEDAEYGACSSAFDAIARGSRDQFLRITARYRAGRCYERGGQYEKAAEAYKEVRAVRALLAPLATLRLSVMRHEQGRVDEALRFVKEASADPALRKRAERFRARILEVAGRDRELVKGFEKARAPNLKLKVVRAHLRLGDETRATQGLRSLVLQDPLGSVGKIARSLLAEKDPDCFKGLENYSCFSPKEMLEVGHSLYRSHASTTIVEVLEPRLVEDALKEPGIACEATLLVARSYTKLRNRKNSLPHYARARSLCRDRKQEPDVLYFGGVDAYREDRFSEALSAFKRLHEAWPKHSYNDDAILYEAASIEAGGDRRAADKLIRKSLDRYPNGDMRSQLGWRYVWSALRRNREKEALSRIREIKKILPAPRGYKGKGRLDYWEARLLERGGKRKEAISGYRAVLTSAPLSFHALLAFQRLRIRKGVSRARKALNDAMASGGGDKNADIPAMTGALGRIALLVRMGLIDEAAKEVPALGGRGDPDALLAIAFLADRVGAYDLSVMIMRRYLSGFEGLAVDGDGRQVWTLAYPRAFQEEVGGHCRAARVDPFLARSIIREESGFVSDIESWANAIGLMQLILPTANKMAMAGTRVSVSPSLLREPDTNIRLGVRYLRHLQGLFAHPALIVAGYNAGEARVESWLKERGHLTMDLFIASIPFRQTRGYTMRVLQTWFRYQVLYGDGGPTLDMSRARVFRRAPKKRKRRR